MTGIGSRSAIYGPNEDFERAAAECACAPHLGSFAEISAADIGRGSRRKQFEISQRGHSKAPSASNGRF